MVVTTWPCIPEEGPVSDEYAVFFDQGRQYRILILPALFDEANKLRRHTVEVMRRLDGAGIDTFLPDLPGCNESLQPLEKQRLATWRDAARNAASHFKVSHVLTIRGGAILTPPNVIGWRYAPQSGSNILRSLLRARLVAKRETGRIETTKGLLETGRVNGLNLGGYRIGPQMFVDLEQSRLADNGKLTDIPQVSIGGSGLWLRSEPGEAPAQADALAATIIMQLTS
ncbi:hypothetical protein MB02_13390 [Croceicoccus estronivorus]|nr:hypothetical protein MB02_13390 [Croceicoccus estronivorus]